ncbi:hypothetical protein Acr_07g0014970 [Actinidia rufa]|uniref:Putative plant transposon protein domain-containing protein n=1 Tax=Actinidia rufa TaxID=165716 RepID=A0A7J0EXW8_9ERIC|nr:hypothetical protein Acr_07g0014970 [Actinidia rufa]
MSDKSSKGTKTKSSAKTTSKGKAVVGSSREGYDDSRFLGVHEEKAYRNIWVNNGAVIERGIRLNAFHSMTEKGSKLIKSWVRGKKIILTPDTFVRYFGLRRVANPEFDYPNVGAPLVSVLCEELLEKGETWDGVGQCSKKKLCAKYLILFLFSCHSLMPLKRTVSMSLLRAQLLWAIGTGKSIDLPRYMFMQVYHAYAHPNAQGSIPFTCVLTRLFKESKVKIPQDLVTQAQENPIANNALSRSEVQKERPEESTSWQAALARLEDKLDTFITSTDARFKKTIEEHAERNTTILQEMMAMMMRSQAAAGGDDKDEDDEDDFEGDDGDDSIYEYYLLNN